MKLSGDEKKGITVKVDAKLHAEVREYLEKNGVTMAEFVSLALENELHPKMQMKEVTNHMGNMRTIAFQVPEGLYQRIKDYLQRNNMTQKEFMIGLIQRELDMDMARRAPAQAVQRGAAGEMEELPEPEETTPTEALAAEFEDVPEDEDEDMTVPVVNEKPTEEYGMSFSMEM